MLRAAPGREAEVIDVLMRESTRRGDAIDTLRALLIEWRDGSKEPRTLEARTEAALAACQREVKPDGLPPNAVRCGLCGSQATVLVGQSGSPRCDEHRAQLERPAGKPQK